MLNPTNPKMFLLMTAATLIACNGKQEDNSDDTAEASESDPGESVTDNVPPGTLVLAESDIEAETVLWVSAEFDLSIDSDGVTGSIEYQEEWESGDGGCQAELTVDGTPVSTTADGVSWAYDLVASTSGGGDCVFAQAELAPGLAGDGWTTTLWYGEDIEYLWSDYDEILAIEATSGTAVNTSYIYTVQGSVESNDSANNWQPGDQNLVYEQSGTGTPVSTVYAACGIDESVEEETNYIGEDAIEETLGKSTMFSDLGDVWAIKLSKGQTVGISVDTEQNRDPVLAVVRPDGCLAYESDDAMVCTGDAGGASTWTECPSLSFTADMDGDWTVVVTESWALDMEYTIDAQVL